MRTTSLTFRIAVLAALVAAGPTAAQVSAGTPSASSYVRDASRTGWVHVDISRLRGPIASELEVDAVSVPNTVEVPMSVAARVCGTDRGDVAGASGEPVTACRAQELTADVRDAVRDKMDRATPDER